MATNDPRDDPIVDTSPTWPKDAIIALSTIFVMILLSGLRILWMYPSQALVWSFFSRRRPRIDGQDIELAPLQRASSSSSDWVDMADVRRYQQQTYTSIARTRRGPASIARLGSKASF